jgi:hypothetical protein
MPATLLLSSPVVSLTSSSRNSTQQFGISNNLTIPLSGNNNPFHLATDILLLRSKAILIKLRRTLHRFQATDILLLRSRSIPKELRVPPSLPTPLAHRSPFTIHHSPIPSSLSHYALQAQVRVYPNAIFLHLS